MGAALILDRDGVLAFFSRERSESLFGAIYPGGTLALERDLRAFVARAGEPRDRDACRSLWSRFCADARTLHRLSDVEAEELCARRPERALELHADAIPILRRARAKGLRVGVLSNFSLFDLEGSLEALGVRGLVDVACSAADLGVAKPETAAYIEVASRLRASPASCLHVDDRVACVDGARRAGMYAELIDRSGRTPGALRSLLEIDEGRLGRSWPPRRDG